MGGEYLRQVKTFLRVYLGLFRLAIKEVSLKHVLTVVGLDLVGVLAYVSVIGLIARFVSITEAGGRGAVGGILPDSPIVNLGLLSAGVLLLLIVAAVSTYGAARRMRRIARRVHVRLVAKSIIALGRVQHLPEEHYFPDATRLNRYIIRDPMQSGIAVEVMLGLFQPTAHVLGAIAIIVYVEPAISLALLTGGLLFIPLLYAVSRSTLRNAQQFYQSRTRRMAQMVRDMVGRYDTTTLRSPTGDEVAEMIGTEDYQAYLDGFDINRLASQRMALVISIFRALAITVGVLVFSWLASEGDRSWGSLIGFVGGLLFFLGGAQGFMGRFATLNRLYPQVRGLMGYLKAIDETPPAEPEQKPPPVIHLSIEAKLPGSRENIDLHHGDTALLVTSRGLRRHTLHGLLRPFMRHTKGLAGLWRNAEFAAAPVELRPGVSIARSVLGAHAGDAGAARLEAFLREVGAGEDMETTGVRMDRPPPPKTLSRDLLAALSVAAVVIARRPPVLFIAYSLVSGASEELLEKLFEYTLADYCFVMVSPGLEPRGLPENMPVLVMEEGGFAGGGDVAWWRERRGAYGVRESSPVLDEGTDSEDELLM